MKTRNRHSRLVGLIILSIFTFHLSLLAVHADDYVEDVYFWPEDAPRDAGSNIVPNFNPRAKEIVFIEDSASAQHPDTVRAIIRDVKPSEYNR